VTPDSTTADWLPQGFRAGSATAGLKDSGSPDVALVVNDGPLHAAAGVFTRSPSPQTMTNVDLPSRKPRPPKTPFCRTPRAARRGSTPSTRSTSPGS